MNDFVEKENINCLSVVTVQGEGATHIVTSEAATAQRPVSSQTVHIIPVVTTPVNTDHPNSSLLNDAEPISLPPPPDTTSAYNPTKVSRHRLSRVDEAEILNAYASGMPMLEIMSVFMVSKTQLARILSTGFQEKKIVPISPRYYLLQNSKQYAALFEFLGCPSAPFLKCEKNGDVLNITAYDKKGIDHE